MEVAASLAKGRGVNVTVVAPEKVPFAAAFGDDIGHMFQQIHEENGITFRMESQVSAFEGEGGRVTSVRLKSGDTLDADFVVVGIGVRPATDFLKNAGLTLDEKDGSVRVSAALNAGDERIYAAGDIARYDDGSERGTRIEHWRVAQQHGIVAARNMLGEQEAVTRHVPFFWTTQLGISLRYVGHASEWDEIIYRDGTPEQRSFVAFYLKGGKLKAAAGVKHDPEMDAIELILRDDLPLSNVQMQDQSFDLIAYALGQKT
jgi:NADPH-dependent 2,4-dienoyl-CoA reductase/sulfur reductase-like enzyme